jgi:predicted nucleotidyltransferase
MMNRASVIADLEKALADEASVAAAYLFGSYAREESREGSDVDLGVLFKEAPPKVLVGPVSELHGRLELALRREIDLVAMNDAPVDLVHRILRDGVLVNEGDPSGRVAFEVRARGEYFDLKPYLDEYRAGPLA